MTAHTKGLPKEAAPKKAPTKKAPTKNKTSQKRAAVDESAEDSSEEESDRRPWKKRGRTSNDASDAKKQVAVEKPKETMRDSRHNSPDDSEVKT